MTILRYVYSKEVEFDRDYGALGKRMKKGGSVQEQLTEKGGSA